MREHRELGLPGFNAQTLEQGQAPEQRLLEVATVNAPAEVAIRLGIEDGSPVVVRRRVFLADAEPVATSERCNSSLTTNGCCKPRWSVSAGIRAAASASLSLPEPAQ